ncbi:MAG: class IV adenylate cyclase [Bryobacteraceae bacterium]
MGREGRRREVEIKLVLESAAAARRLLARAGFRCVHRRTLQDDAVFDDAAGRLRRAGLLLRLRRSDRGAWLTFKGPAATGRHKEREELETPLAPAAADVLGEILARLGFRVSFRYQKYRTEYARPGEKGIAALDETPIGVFLELEGPPSWIDRTARKLGFTPDRYLTATYAELYLDHCKRHRLKPGHLMFRDTF